MATKETEMATVPARALVPAGMEGMIQAERPEGRDAGDLGTGHIGRDDVLIPRLALAQKTSPEIDPTSERYIDGLKFTELFHSVSRRTYGNGPLYFSVLRADPPRWVEFNPLEAGGGVKDPNVPIDDPRAGFGPNGEKPVATKFYDFIVLLLNDLDQANPLENVVGLSFKSTGIRVARQLNLLITQRGNKLLPKGVYELRSDVAENKNGKFAVYKVKNAGWLAPGSPVERLAVEMFESWKDRAVEIDREHPAAGGDGGDGGDSGDAAATHGGDKPPF